MGHLRRLSQLALVLLMVIGSIGMMFHPVHYRSLAEVRYIAAGQRLADGLGLTIPGSLVWATNGLAKPFTHGPPLLALFAGLITLLPVAFDVGIKLLNVSAFVGTLIFPYLTVKRLSGNPVWGVLSAFGIIAVPFVAQLFFMVGPEPLFLCLIMAHLYRLVRVLEASTIANFLLAAGTLSLAFFTRYAALPLIVVSSMALLIHTRNKTGKLAIGYAMGYGLIAVMPTGLFIVMNALSSGRIGNRTPGYHALQPSEMLALLAVAGGTLIIVALCTWLDNESAPLQRVFRWVIAGYIWCYLAFILIAALFFDAALTIAVRMLAPVYVVMPILVALLLKSLSGSRFKRAEPWLTSLITLALIIPTGLFVGVSLNNLSFSNLHITPDDAISTILPDHVVIYTDRPELVYLAASQEPYAIPLRYDPFTGEENQAITSDIDTMRAQLTACEAVLIYYDQAHGYVMTKQELLSRLDLPLLQLQETTVQPFYAYTPCHFTP